MTMINSYPSYIPKKWIHYAQHGKRKRIRKKYQNRILRHVRNHEVDTETFAFLCNHATKLFGVKKTVEPFSENDIERLIDSFQESVSTLWEALIPVIEKAIEIFKNLSNMVNKILKHAELEEPCSYIDDVDKLKKEKDDEEHNEDKEDDY